MKPLFDPSGGYRKLDAFLFASLIQLETKRYCERYLTLKNDPKGRQFDQMTQAARSGRANIMEGSQRASTSKADEMRLIDVARASLVELMGDFEMELLQRGSPPWSRDSDAAKRVSEWQLEPHGEWTDPIHDSGVYLLALPENQRNLLEFYSAKELKNPYLREHPPMIVGIAFGKDEALFLTSTTPKRLSGRTFFASV